MMSVEMARIAVGRTTIEYTKLTYWCIRCLMFPPAVTLSLKNPQHHHCASRNATSVAHNLYVSAEKV